MANYKEIKTTAYLEAIDFTGEIEDEMVDNSISTHYEGSSFYIDWSDSDDMPVTQAWLLKTYGPAIKEFGVFTINPT
jgi:hypothetical protein